jgi:hypothetical protein
MDICDALQEHVGHIGRMLSGSKQGPHTVYWNACVFTEDGEQVWFGDADPTEEADKFQAAANACGQILLVTPEQPFRFSGLDGKKKDWGHIKVHKEDRARIVKFTPEAS